MVKFISLDKGEIIKKSSDLFSYISFVINQFYYCIFSLCTPDSEWIQFLHQFCHILYNILGKLHHWIFNKVLNDIWKRLHINWLPDKSWSKINLGTTSQHNCNPNNNPLHNSIEEYIWQKWALNRCYLSLNHQQFLTSSN